jgi:hypothetical protein
MTNTLDHKARNGMSCSAQPIAQLAKLYRKQTAKVRTRGNFVWMVMSEKWESSDRSRERRFKAARVVSVKV